MLSKMCCMRLSTAGIFIGYLGIFGSIGFFILYAFALVNVDVVAPIIEKSIQENVNPTALAIALKFYLGGFALNILTSTLLVMGIRKKRPALLIPWLAISGFAMILNVCYCLVLWLNIIVNGERMLQTLITTIPYLSLYIYIYYGIYSLYDQLCVGEAYTCPQGRIRDPAFTGVYPV